MARIKFGAIVTDARGKLGGHYFNKAKGVATIATKPNAPSKYFYQKNKQFNILIALNNRWSALTLAQQANFRYFASLTPVINEFGDSRLLSGRAVFQRMLANVQLAGITDFDFNKLDSKVPAVNYIPYSTTPLSIILGSFGDVVNVVISFYAVNQKTTYFDYTRLRYIGFVQVPVSGVIWEAVNYITPEQFAMALNGSAFFMFKPVNSSGWSGNRFVASYVQGQRIN